ncbi:MAG: hypothetical protein RLZZ126_1832 [Pseudomonadota bacterium]
MQLGLSLSLVVHALLLSLSFGSGGSLLPMLTFPWQDRRIEAPEPRIALLPTPAAVPADPQQDAAADPPTGSGPSGLTWVNRKSPRAPSAATAAATATARFSEKSGGRRAKPQVKPVPQVELTPTANVAPAPEPPVIDNVIALDQSVDPRWTVLPASERDTSADLPPAQVIDPKTMAPPTPEAVDAKPSEQERQQAAVREEAARAQAAQLEAERQAATRQEAARQELAHQEAIRQEAARVQAARLELERQEMARQQAARAQAVQLEAERQAAARQEAARQELARQEAIRQEATKAQAARLEQERHEAEQREERRRAMGRQLNQEAEQREAAAAATRLSPSASPLRRGRLFGRTDPNAELIAYAEAWSRKIQLNMTFDMIREAAKQPHTDPMVTVAIRSDGSVESVSFVRSSGVAGIDDAIRRIVHSQANYQAFPPALVRHFDVIEIRRTWYFDMSVRLY